MAKLKDQTKVLKEVAPAAVGFLAPSSGQHTDILVYCTVTCQVAISHWAAVARLCLLFPTPVGPYFLMEYQASEISCPLGSPNRGFQEGTWAAWGMKKEAGRKNGEDSKEIQGQKKLLLFFPLINQITRAHSCCSWLAGLKNNSESPMLLMTSASCVGFGHFSSVFLAEGRKQHEGMEEERVKLLLPGF